MTCSACHTRQITVEGRAYRIDGGPAIVDFQGLLAELDAAAGNVRASNAAFAPFASAVLASPLPDPQDVKALRADFEAWYLRYHTLVSRALPQPAWGPSRLDAISMIFNRLTGLDLGTGSDQIIANNIKPADAPARYPFIWNAPIQDQIQWAGFADNGSDILALSRNVGEVFGVFGQLRPKKELLFTNFISENSVNFDGLSRNEFLVKQIGPPKWPWAIDEALRAQGEAIFARRQEQGGCQNCHGITDGKTRFPLQKTWATPVRNVGTDTRQFDVLTRSAATGVLNGASIPGLTKPLKATDSAFNILKTSVIGSIVQHYIVDRGGRLDAAADLGDSAARQMALNMLHGRLPIELRDLRGAYNLPDEVAKKVGIQPLDAAPADAGPTPQKGSYEARVMQGIWAAAPYLHNGSVPTLADLLKPAAERPKKFKIGPAYDITAVGLAAAQTLFDYELQTTGCDDLNSGNSRCGHEFGASLSEPEKRALLEYLKAL